MILRVFIVLFLFISSASADTTPSPHPQPHEPCNNYDLSKKFPWPSRDQDSMGWCFGFVAADIISAQQNQQVSAADVSMNYFYGENSDLSAAARKDRLEVINSFGNGRGLDLAVGRERGPLTRIDKLSGGLIKDAIQLTEARGACLEKNFPSEDYKFSRHITNLKSLLRTLDAEKTTEIPESYNEATDNLHGAIPNASRSDITFALNAKTLDPFSTLADKLCKKRTPFRFNHFKDHYFSDDYTHKTYLKEKNMKRQIVSKNLAAGHPISISYKSNVLLDPKSKPSKGFHGSIVLGQRLNPKNNKCELLLRNSWGDCGYAHSSYECNKKNGHIWLPKDDLLRNTIGIHEAY